MSTITALTGTHTLATMYPVVNSNFTALQNVFASSVAPTSPVAYQLWWDTTTAASPILKARDSTNSSWITIIPNGGAANGAMLPLSGGTLTGAINHGGGEYATNLASATVASSAATKGQVDAMTRTDGVLIGAVSATGNYYLICGGPALTIVDVSLVSSAGVASSGVDFWTFQVRNLTASLDLRSAAKSTNGAAITADATYALGLDQNLTPAANAVLQLQIVKTGSPAALAGLLVVCRYKVAV